MRILIVDQCSSTKDVPDAAESFDEQTLKTHSREDLLTRKHVHAVPACDLYDGQQQRLISSAVDRLRDVGDSVDRVFISAGFGVVDEATVLPPYDATFTDRSDDEITERATALGIQEDLHRCIESGGPYDVIFFALGGDYYQSFDLRELLNAVPASTKVILFNQEEIADEYEHVRSISARNGEAKEYETPVISLKGRYLQNFAEHREDERDVEGVEDIVSYCTTASTEQTGVEDYES